VFSNLVIEKVGNLRAQLEMARHVRALGTYWWVQTPARSFPVEPHFYFPLFPYLPLGLRTALYQNLKLGFMGQEPDWLKARMACEETRLLTRRELQAIFENCRIVDQRLYGLLKSRTATNM
jgi:hypothetical protein